MEKVSLDDPIGHMYVVDIEFDHEKATDQQIMYNEILPPIVDKKAILKANERSLLQLLELYSEDIKGTPKNYCIHAAYHCILKN